MNKLKSFNSNPTISKITGNPLIVKIIIIIAVIIFTSKLSNSNYWKWLLITNRKVRKKNKKKR